MSNELQVSIEGHAKKFKISPIYNGIVIDHLPNEDELVDKIRKILGLSPNDQVMIGLNFDSTKTGPRSKNIIKVEDFPLDRFTQEMQDKIAVICRKAKYPTSILFIKDGGKQNRILPELPTKIVNVIKCFNPRCITVVEGHTVVRKTFHVLEKDPLKVMCHYCGRIMKEEEQEITLI